MRIRHRNDGIEAVYDTAEDRDLIAMVNEAHDPAEIAQISAMARHRWRARRRDADATDTRGPAVVARVSPDAPSASGTKPRATPGAALVYDGGGPGLWLSQTRVT